MTDLSKSDPPEQLDPADERRATPTPGDVILKATNLSKHFGRNKSLVKAVDDVSFEIRSSEITTVVGESGSGKSTLARLILRLMPPTSGTIELHGTDVSRIKGRALHAYWRDVQAVFQDPFSAFNQFFTVRRLLSRSKGMLDLKGESLDDRMKTAIDQVGLKKDSLDKYPHQLSGGQRQRVMIARALMMRPVLLIADEATSMLDASLRANILNVLTDLRADTGLTILFITHDIGQACYVSDRILVMQHGKLVESGPTEDVIFRPQHEYTQQLLEDVPRLHG
ncbi:dipeptide/oligopeptide/nickel ABC transporter ATP-binding protein [Virgisporangium ochraceum]|uniref:Dipeptide/oligopeptide/nickel ABC transporter ATP-binding protein n=1 Tax=Virgisporangium ochraceum TaxID=65505 RepID=A0A8J3ZTY7_9ACTN|nr:ABC transporter ATP-binding protein [Virgisporangium ochraceum]GIJ67446.1 dipeptide/oligopeptide/nickel ABC transporter ATP-binding protein [Virgisporangium ochraceum]